MGDKEAIIGEIKRGERWMIGLTIIIALATAANVCVFWLESESTSKQIETLSKKAEGIIGAMNTALKDNQEAINKAFAENKEALRANEKQSKRALDASIQSTRLDQRAWIGVIEVRTTDPVVRDRDFGFKSLEIVMHNSGRSPANAFQIHCCINDVARWPFPKTDPDYDTLVQEFINRNKQMQEEMKRRWQNLPPWMSRPEIPVELTNPMSVIKASVLPPGAIRLVAILPATQVPRRDYGQNSPQLPDHMFGTPIKFYYLGQITYSDIFTGTPQHSTKFCLVYDGGNQFRLCEGSQSMN